MREEYILAHDLGTGSDKAAVVDTDSDIIDQMTSEYEVSYPEKGCAIQDPEYNPFFDRLEKCMEVVEERESETGEKTIYTINVTCAIADLLERAEKAVEEGANGLLLDSSVGLSGLRMLAEDPSIDVPILYHPDFIGNICGAEKSGIDWTL